MTEISLFSSFYVQITTWGIHIRLTPVIQTNPMLKTLLFFASANAEKYLILVLVLLISLCFKQLHAFTRPPPVQRKVLPRRPALQVLFKPDDGYTGEQERMPSNNHNHPSRSFQDPSKDIDCGSIGLDTDPSIPTVVVSDNLHHDANSTSMDNNTFQDAASATSNNSGQGNKYDYKKVPKKPTIDRKSVV